MRLTLARRVAGEAKCTPTFVQLLEDLSCAGARASRMKIVGAGFLDYRMVGVNLDVPPPGDNLHAELASAELFAALRDGLGADPRMLSGRLAVLVELTDDGAEAITGLRDRGYTVKIDVEKAIS
jgi:hypothetical protein